MRDLNFLQVVDAHRIVVAFTRENHFYKVGHHTELDQLTRTVLGMHRHTLVGLARQLTGRDIKTLPYALGHTGDRKLIKGMAHVPAGIAIL